MTENFDTYKYFEPTVPSVEEEETVEESSESSEEDVRESGLNAYRRRRLERRLERWNHPALNDRLEYDDLDVDLRTRLYQ